MRILVTGGAGFIGKHLCRRLMGDGYEVWSLDLAHSAFSNNERERCANVKWISSFADYPKFDRIYHLACHASPAKYQLCPDNTLETCLWGTSAAISCAANSSARILLSSTSEIYGEPEVHPQPESYRGNVNCNGPRSCYDEGKRASETMMWCARKRGADTRIARIFNSIVGDEDVLFDDGRNFRRCKIQDISPGEGNHQLKKSAVPAFDGSGAIALSTTSWIVGHPTTAKCYEIKTRYGRSVRVTADHSLFIKGDDGNPVATAASEVKIGQHIGIAGALRIDGRDRRWLHMLCAAEEQGLSEWSILVCGDGVGDAVWSSRREIERVIVREKPMAARDRKRAASALVVQLRDRNQMPLAVARRVGYLPPATCKIKKNMMGRSLPVPSFVEISDALLWLFGLYVAEGCFRKKDGDHYISISCEEGVLRRAEKIIYDCFGLNCVWSREDESRARSIYIHSHMLLKAFSHLELISKDKRIPGWILGLPLSRLKWFLEGYREGDGVHSGKKLSDGRKHEFSTVSHDLAKDLLVALSRFGLVASLGKYVTRLRKKTGDRTYPFWRVTIPSVSPWSILEWDESCKQNLNACRFGDVVWAVVKSVTEIKTPQLVYDFCVPGKENFWAGTGVMCHNTYGPGMDFDDGRVISNFVTQALRGEPLTIYGDGSQTRSFCYIDDMVEGLIRLMEYEGEECHEPCNLGNPEELSVIMIGRTVRGFTPSGMPAFVYNPLPQDDPTRRCPDITRAKRNLGWEPKVSLSEGLRRTVEDFRERMK